MPTGVPFLYKHGQSFKSEVIDIQGEVQVSTAFSTTATATVGFEEGVFDIWADQDCYIEVIASGASAAVTSSTGYLLRANNTVPLAIRRNSMMGVVRSTASGTLYAFKTG